VLGEDLTRRGQPHAATCAVEQPHAERVLELSDGLRQRRLGHRETHRRAAEVELVAHREEVPEVADLDRR
jgi:hypothetical protein